MNIVITNNGDKDCTDIHVQLFPRSCPEGIVATWKCSSVPERYALEKLLRDDLNTTVELLVQKAYYEGWNDHRQKKRKKTFFTSFMKRAGSTTRLSW